jgi:alkanesulfonate monooxygenase SsuD/methylene tetrahydromethanopterin reductase-like flavin-dependent oxidoreductase (luciferase family)
VAASCHAGRVKHAVFLPVFGDLADPRRVAAVAADAEAAGWDGVFVWDHMAYRPPVVDIADPWVALAAAACATERVRLGPMVTPLPRRRPWKVAREVASLDLLSAGRVTLGVGLGGDPGRELSGLGEELDPVRRGVQLDEALDICVALWAGGEVHHRGEAFVVDGMRFGPPPVQRPRPPVWVAGRWPNRAPLRRAARFDGYFPVEVDTADRLAELVADLPPTRPGFEVVAGGPVDRDPRPFEAAGATWWLTGFSPFTVGFDETSAVARGGPPA